MNAVAAVGLERARMHEALAAALIKDEADRAIFDESFNRFFASPRAERGEHPDQRGDSGLRRRRPRPPRRESVAARRIAAAPVGRAARRCARERTR